MTTEALPSAVCDAGPLIHLDELCCLDLLADFRQVLVPAAVREEVERHRPDCLRVPAASGFVTTPDDIAPSDLLGSLCRTFALDRGETAALAVLAHHPEALFLTDDAAARLVAVQTGRRVHGTIGLLLRSVRRGRRTALAILHLLEALPSRSTLHIRPSLLSQILQEARREFGSRPG